MRYFTDMFKWAIILNKDFRELIVGISCCSNLYSLYAIICYSYVNLYEEKYKDYIKFPVVEKNMFGPKVINEDELLSFSTVVYQISYSEGGENSQYDSHFKTYQITALRKIKRFFGFVFDSKDGLDVIVRDDKKRVFDLFSFGFISFLLEPGVSKDLNNFVNQRYHLVSKVFYRYAYYGVYLIVDHYQTDLTVNDIDKMWSERFHFDKNCSIDCSEVEEFNLKLETARKTKIKKKVK